MELLYMLVLILYFATPLITGRWMIPVWRQSPRTALVVGGIVLTAWVVSMTALVLFFLSGHWYSESSPPEMHRRGEFWMATASLIVFAVNFGLIVGTPRRPK